MVTDLHAGKGAQCVQSVCKTGTQYELKSQACWGAVLHADCYYGIDSWSHTQLYSARDMLGAARRLVRIPLLTNPQVYHQAA